MKISFVEIENFRKLRSIRVDFAPERTLFVGANNSGKTSAMIALGHFLVDQRRFSGNDFTLSHWTVLNRIGQSWEDLAAVPNFEESLIREWGPVLPKMDVWLEIERSEVHHVSHLLPRFSWDQEPIGVRLRFEPKKLEDLYQDYVSSRKASRETVEAAKAAGAGAEFKVKLWPANMQDFLERRFSTHFTVRHYILDPAKIASPQNGRARLQDLPTNREPMEGNPFSGLIRIDQIQAQRGFSDAGGSNQSAAGEAEERQDSGSSHKLSSQLRRYYATHINPSNLPEPADVEALEAIFSAQEVFDGRLREGFKRPFNELEDLGYPGLSNPKLRLSTKVEPTDGLKHSSALQYDVIPDWDEDEGPCPSLPEQYNGLGFQNLISIVFRLMSYRDAWMRVGKADKGREEGDSAKIPPLHLVLVEEPEAHLHAQVQQVFIRRAYEFLRKHPNLGNDQNLRTQLVVSTHSSHIVHEEEFAGLRYFRRLPAQQRGESPTTVVVNMSEVFGHRGKTAKFVARYLRAAHCDLFFADAAILVEGPAERILIPHFISSRYPKLRNRYVTLLDIGGSHAHRLRPLIDHLGLTTLVVTDIDSARTTESKRLVASRTRRGANLVSGNATLRLWNPRRKQVDELLDLEADQKIIESDFSAVRVAYQIPLQIEFPEGAALVEFCSYTFEDSLVSTNLPLFKNLKGEGLIRQFKGAIRDAADVDDLSERFFGALKNGDKAEFATNLIFAVDPAILIPPAYLAEGLSWLEEQLNARDSESASEAPTTPATIVKDPQPLATEQELP